LCLLVLLLGEWNENQKLVLQLQWCNLHRCIKLLPLQLESQFVMQLGTQTKSNPWHPRCRWASWRCISCSAGIPESHT
jgi:hypothetical protein